MMRKIAKKRAVVYGTIGLLMASTVLYSVVNSAQSASIAQEGSGTAACSIVHAVCSINADAGFCVSAAATRACDAMLPSPFTGLVGSSTSATFFLVWSLLLAGILCVLYTLSTVRMRERITLIRTAAKIFFGCNRSPLLAGEFPALRF